VKVRRVEHVAIAVRHLPDVRRLFEETLGLALEYEEHLPQYETKIAMYPVGETYLELLQGTGPASDVTRWVERKGQGLYHLCLEVDDIEAALAELRARGVRLLDEQPRAGHAGTRIAFLDPRSTADILIELVQVARPPEGAGGVTETQRRRP
jgi:methylmalonyl-CoA/ethylmalonyl-CoA epimerase